MVIVPPAASKTVKVAEPTLRISASVPTEVWSAGGIDIVKALFDSETSIILAATLSVGEEPLIGQIRLMLAVRVYEM